MRILNQFAHNSGGLVKCAFENVQSGPRTIIETVAETALQLIFRI